MIRSTDALWGVFAALFLFALVGFEGVSKDNTQYLLGAYKLNDADFLINDWFVQHTRSFHPFFEYYVLSWLQIDKLTTGLFVWFSINLLLLSAVLIIWLRTLGITERMPLALIIVAAILVVGVRHGWGKYEIIADQALPAYLAYPSALLSIALLLHRRFFSSACALATTFVIHHGLGALLVLCMTGPFLVTLPRSRQEVIRAGLGAALVAIVFVPVVFGTINLDSGKAEDFSILFYGRAAHHYAIQYFSLRIHLASLHIIAISILLARMLPSPELRLQILALITSIVVLCVLGYLLLEVWYVPVFVRLFPYRALPILVGINACMIAFYLLSSTSTRVELLTVIAAFLSSIAFQYNIAVWAVLLGIAIFLGVLPRGDRIAPTEMRAGLILVCTIGVIALMTNRYNNPPAYFLQPPSERHAALKNAIGQHTPEDAIIVVPPWLVGARLIINRAIVVNLKSFPVYAGEMAGWADRIRDVSGVDPRDAKQYLELGANVFTQYFAGYQNRSVDDLAAAARKYNADFVLVSTVSQFHLEARKSGVRMLWLGNRLALYRTPGE